MLIGPIIHYGADTFVPSDEVLQSYPPFRNLLHMEFEHLSHFKAIALKQMPELSVRLHSNGTNPPDFLVYRGSDARPFGFELTTFGIPTEERQQNAYRFSKLHERLIEAFEAGRLQGLSGIKFQVIFGSDEQVAGPACPIDDGSFTELVEALEGVAALPRVDLTSDDLQLDRYVSGVLSGGQVSWKVVGFSDGPFRESMFGNRTGCEVECRVHESKSLQTAIEEMEETIRRKDEACNQELLIVAGGPTQRGRLFPAGATMARLIAEAWAGHPTVRPVHLERVFLDVWGADKLYLLWDAEAT